MPRLCPSTGTRLAIATAAAGLTGCAVGPDYTRPETPTPVAWHHTDGSSSDGDVFNAQSLASWWKTFNDPTLNELIARATASNLDLKQAFARIDAARAARGIAESERLPQVDATGSYERLRPSARGLDGPVAETDDVFRTGLDAAWELDVFGRIRRSVEAADGELGATVEEARDVMVVLQAEVALNYIDVRQFQRRLKLAHANVDTQAAALALAEDRFRAQVAPELEVVQARTNLETTRSIIPQLETGLSLAMNRLAVLTGEAPGALHPMLEAPTPLPVITTRLSAGLPADIIRRRPDIRQAERELAAQTARIGVVTADLYPRFVLNGSIGLEATHFSGLSRSGSDTFSFGPSVRWNLFSGGRIRNNIRASEALAREALLRYEQTVLLGLEEVEDALVAYRYERQRTQTLIDAEDASRDAVALVDELYRNGLTSFLNVLDAQRSLFELQDELATSRATSLKNLIGLYKALGGGWPTDAVAAGQHASTDAQTDS